MTTQEYCQIVSMLDQQNAETERWHREAMYQLKQKHRFKAWSLFWCAYAVGAHVALLVWVLSAK